ncbi:hypothetical protein FNV43_RR06017 [Rhamnella rubrinervis]|uniref:VQ domain-containing protein n=1 Tax=Rhamnella rubrinervis TaxID=2594499 RepID=A0A8K0HDS1_9ROSA|nr:hypothetical protein FNV43_RR06017 [Rhamnella rubrinervis]
MAASSSNAEAVKVVLIDTQYVQTDATSFKSVVQSLTGKDSCVAWIEKGSFTGGAKRKNKTAIQLSSSGINVAGTVDGGLRDSNISKVLSKGMSFKDLDRMMLELPSTEDLQYWLWDSQ